MNCRKKDSLSLLRKVGGNAAYGQFHVFQELWLEMQQHRPQAQNFFIINESTLLKELGINARSFPKHIEMFHQTCGIQFEKICKTIANVSYINWKITIPKSLIFIDSSRLKNTPKGIGIGKGIGKGIGIDQEKPDQAAPPAPTSTPDTQAEKPRKSGKRKTSFEDSNVHDMGNFVAACPPDWKFDEVKYWHGQAAKSSNKGNKYINWVAAVKNWRKDEPDQFAKWKATHGGEKGGPWGASKAQCSAHYERDGQRFGCQLKEGHDGPHEFEELYQGVGIKTSGPGRVDVGPQRIVKVLDCEGLDVKPGEPSPGKSDVSHGT